MQETLTKWEKSVSIDENSLKGANPNEENRTA
jgi:hypothetical protein